MNLIRCGRRRWKCTSKRRGEPVETNVFSSLMNETEVLFSGTRQPNRPIGCIDTRTGTCAPRRSNHSHSHDHKKKKSIKGLCLRWEEGNKAAVKKRANILARRGSRLHTQQKAAEEQKNRMLRPNDETWQTASSPSSPGDSL